MKESLNNTLIGILWGILICVLITLVGGRFQCKDETVYKEVRDTITDTIAYYQPIARDSVITRYHVVRVPVIHTDTSYTAGDTVYITRADTAEVRLPIVQKRYNDSLYTAWVSGYMATLDSIKVKSNTIYINKVKKPKRWGVGVQAGYGINGKPYIGVGVTYNTFQF